MKIGCTFGQQPKPRRNGDRAVSKKTEGSVGRIFNLSLSCFSKSLLPFLKPSSVSGERKVVQELKQQQLAFEFLLCFNPYNHYHA